MLRIPLFILTLLAAALIAGGVHAQAVAVLCGLLFAAWLFFYFATGLLAALIVAIRGD